MPIEPPTVITLQYHCPDGLLNSMYVYSRTSDCEQLTIASRCPPTPMTIGHAGTIFVSLQSVPRVTGVGHCGFKGCTRDTSMTICRSIGGRTTADSYREDTVTTFLVTVCNASTCNSMQTKRYASIHMHNHASKSTCNIIHTHAP